MSRRAQQFLAVAALATIALTVVAVLRPRSRATTAGRSSAAPTVLSAPRAARPPQAPAVRQRPSRPRVQADPEDTDARLRTRRRRDLHQRPAFQHLPFERPGLSIDIVDTTTDGRLKLRVTHIRNRASARRAYRRFLASYHDDGRAYVVTYRHVHQRYPVVRPREPTHRAHP